MTGSLKIIVEAQSDLDVIRAILGTEVSKRVQFYVGQGKISLASLGRNILVHDGGPVLVVQDADTTNRKLIDEQRGFVRLALGRFASEGEYDAFLFVPEIEAVYFDSPAALEQVIGGKPSPDLLRAGEISPKAALTSAGVRGPYSLTPKLAEHLASGKQAKELREKVASLLQHSTVA